METLTKCPTCGGDCMMTIGGLDLVENTGDETLATKSYQAISLEEKAGRPEDFPWPKTEWVFTKYEQGWYLHNGTDHFTILDLEQSEIERICEAINHYPSLESQIAKLKEENENGKKQDAMYLSLLGEMRGKLHQRDEYIHEANAKILSLFEQIKQRDELLDRMMKSITALKEDQPFLDDASWYFIDKTINDYQNLKK